MLVMLIDTPVPVGPGVIVELELGKGGDEAVEDVNPGEKLEVGLSPVPEDDKEIPVDKVTPFDVSVGPTRVVELVTGYGTELVPVSDGDKVLGPLAVAEAPLVCDPDEGAVKLCEWLAVGLVDPDMVVPFVIGKGAELVVRTEPVGDDGTPVLGAEPVAVESSLVDCSGRLPDGAVGPPINVEFETGNGAELCEKLVAEIVSLPEGRDVLPVTLDGPTLVVAFETEKEVVTVGTLIVTEETGPVPVGPTTDVVFEVGNGGVEDEPVTV